MYMNSKIIVGITTLILIILPKVLLGATVEESFFNFFKYQRKI